MARYSRLILVMLHLFVVAADLDAQQGQEDQYFYLPVSRSFLNDDSSLSILLDNPFLPLLNDVTEAWLVESETGEVYPVTLGGVENSSGRGLLAVPSGHGVPEEHVETLEFLIIRFDEPTGSWDLLRDIFRNGVILTLDQKPIVTADHALFGNADLKSLEAQILRTIRPFGERFLNESESGSEVLQPIGKGRFDTLSLAQALESVDPELLRDFLLFVQARPQEFRSSGLPIQQAFAYWVMVGGPIPPERLYQMLVSSDSAERRNLLKRHADELTEFELVDNWISRAERVGTLLEKVDSARKILRMTYDASTFLGNQRDRAWTHFVRARLFTVIGETDSSITEYYRALPLFEQRDDSIGLAASLGNLSYALFVAGRTDEGLQVVDRVIRIREELLTPESSAAFYTSLGTAYDTRGLLEGQRGERSAGEDAFRRAMELYRAAERVDLVGFMYYRIGASRNEVGAYESARDLFDSAIALYRSVDEEEGEADVLDALAYGYSSQGVFDEALALYQRAYSLHMSSGNIDDAGFSRANMGQSYWSIGDYYEAEVAHNEAILLRQDAGNLSGEAYSRQKIGEMHQANGKPIPAERSLTEAARLYQQAGDLRGEAAVAQSIGELFATYGTVASAISSFDRAVTLFMSIKDTIAAANALTAAGDLLLEKSRYDEAVKRYESARTLVIGSGSPGSAFRSTTGIGLVYWNRGELDEARVWLERARGLAELNNSPGDIAWSLHKIAQVDVNSGRVEEAKEAYRRALELYIESGNLDGEIEVRLDLGYQLVEAGRFNDGMQEYERALRIATEEGRGGKVGDVMSAIAGLKSMIGQFDEALEADSLSLRLATDSENDWGVAGAHIGLGNTFNTMGEFRTAHLHYGMADSIYNMLGNELGRATPLNNIGTIWYFQGDYPRALETFTDVLSILRENNSYTEFLAIVVSNIGEVHLEQGKYREAEEWLLTAREIADSVGARRVRASIETILARAYLYSGNLESAESTAQRARVLSEEIGEIEQTAEVYGVLGETEVRLGSVKKGMASLLKAVEYARSIGSYRYIWRPLYNLGLLNRDLGETDEAIATLVESVDAIEHMRSRISGGDEAVKLFASDKTRIRVYEVLIGLLIKSGDVERAMGYLDRSSSEDLRSRFATARATAGEGSDALKIQRKMKARLDRLTEEIVAEQNRSGSKQKIDELKEIRSVAETEYIGFVNTTIAEQPDLRSFFTDGFTPLDLRSRKRKIPEGMGVLSYLPGDDNLFVFVATRDTVVARVIPVSRPALAESIDRLYNVISVAPGRDATVDREGVIAEESGRLYGWLIAPVEDRISSMEMIAVIPAGELHFLPFDILAPDGDVSRRLSGRSTLFTISNLGVFTDQHDGDLPLRVAAFANPDGSLPESEEEARQIVSFFPSSLLYIGDEATETRAKEVSSEYSMLHLATHGTLDYHDLENSWFTLAPGENGDDGRLTLEEIWRITHLTDYRLVTLSACNTAVGGELVEGWPINPANAFLQVGVPSVVATLWRVDDQATSILMVEFYRNLREHGTAYALQSARVKLASTEEWNDPYYWAPFVLLGDWR